MTSSSDLNLEALLQVAIQRANEQHESEEAYLDEMLPMISGKIHSQNTERAYERLLVEQSIARINYMIKNKYRCLTNFFESIPDSWIGEIWISDAFQNKYYLTEEDWDFSSQVCHSTILMDNVIILSNMSSEIVKIRTAELLNKEVLSDDYSGKKGLNWILENGPISHEHRPEFLMKCGVIDSDLNRNIKDIIDFRNDVIHELGIRHQIQSPEDLITHVDNCLSVIELLDEKLGYAPMVKMYEEFSKKAHMEKSVGDIRSVVAEMDLNSIDEVYDVVGDQLIRDGITNEHSPVRKEIVDVIENKDEFHDFFHSVISDINEEADNKRDVIAMILGQAELLKDNFGVNLLERLDNRRHEYESRIPNELFNEDWIREYDSE